MVVGKQIHSVHVTDTKWLCLCVCMCVCLCVYMCACMHMCVCVCVCVCVRACIQSDSHTCGASVFVYPRQIYGLGLYFNVTPEAR